MVCICGYVNKLETYLELDLIKNESTKQKTSTVVNDGKETIYYYLKNRAMAEFFEANPTTLLCSYEGFYLP
jgi:hypothetical protein